jgi:hypothetical protein
LRCCYCLLDKDASYTDEYKKNFKCLTNSVWDTDARVRVCWAFPFLQRNCPPPCPLAHLFPSLLPRSLLPFHSYLLAAGTVFSHLLCNQCRELQEGVAPASGCAFDSVAAVPRPPLLTSFHCDPS